MTGQQLSVFKRKLKTSEIAYTDLNGQFVDAQKELRGFEAEWDCLKKSYDAAQDYIKSLEAELCEYEQIIKHIPKAKIATISRQATESERKEKRALNELNALGIGQLKSVRKENMREVGTLTEIFGTDKTLQFLEETFRHIYKEQFAQTERDVADASWQTDPESVAVTKTKAKPKEKLAAKDAEAQCEPAAAWLTRQLRLVKESVLAPEKKQPHESPAADISEEAHIVGKQPRRTVLGTRSKGSNSIQPSVLLSAHGISRDLTLPANALEPCCYSPVPLAEDTIRPETAAAPAGCESQIDTIVPEQSAEAPLLQLLGLGPGQASAGKSPAIGRREQQAIQQLGALMGIDVGRICPLCRRRRKNPRRPVIKVTPFNVHGFDHMLSRKLGIENHDDRGTQTEPGPVSDPYIERQIEQLKKETDKKRTMLSRSACRSKRRIIVDRRADSSIDSVTPECVPKESSAKDLTRAVTNAVKKPARGHRATSSVYQSFDSRPCANKRLSSLLWKQKNVYDAQRKKALSRGDTPESGVVSVHRHQTLQDYSYC